jgi:hypothetical protein
VDTEDNRFEACNAEYDSSQVDQWINKKVQLSSGKEKFMRLRFRTSDDFRGTFFLDNVTLKQK